MKKSTKSLAIIILLILLTFSLNLTNFFIQNRVNAEDTQEPTIPVLRIGIDTAAHSIASFRPSGQISGFCSDFEDKLKNTLGIKDNHENNPYEIQPVELTNKYLEKPNLQTSEPNLFHRYDSLKMNQIKNESGKKINVDLICGANTNFRKFFITDNYKNKPELQWINNWDHVDFSDNFHLATIKLLLKKDSILYNTLLENKDKDPKTILKEKGITILATLETTTNYQLQKYGYENFVDFRDSNENIDFNYKSRKHVLKILENNCNENPQCKYVYASDTLILKTLLKQGYEDLGYTIYPTDHGLYGTEEEKYAIAFNKENRKLIKDKEQRHIKEVIQETLSLMSNEKEKLQVLEQEKFISCSDQDQINKELEDNNQKLNENNKNLNEELKKAKERYQIPIWIKYAIVAFLVFSIICLISIFKNPTLKNQFLESYIVVLITLFSGIAASLATVIDILMSGK